jgi:hypothetical protein
MSDPAGSDAEAIAAFRAAVEAMGVHDAEADDLIESAREAARAGGLSLAEALREELAELAVHLGREG